MIESIEQSKEIQEIIEEEIEIMEEIRKEIIEMEDLREIIKVVVEEDLDQVKESMIEIEVLNIVEEDRDPMKEWKEGGMIRSFEIEGKYLHNFRLHLILL